MSRVPNWNSGELKGDAFLPFPENWSGPMSIGGPAQRSDASHDSHDEGYEDLFELDSLDGVELLEADDPFDFMEAPTRSGWEDAPTKAGVCVDPMFETAPDWPDIEK